MKNSVTKNLFDWVTMIVACVIYSLGIALFLSPNALAPGGMSGVAIIINELSGLPTGMMIVILNIPLLIAGFFIVYFDVIVNKEIFTALGTYLQFCSPFSLPANIIIGEMSVVKIAIALGILVISTLIVLVMTARVYKSMILFNGAKITPEVI